MTVSLQSRRRFSALAGARRGSADFETLRVWFQTKF